MNKLQTTAATMGIPLNTQKLEQFEVYYNELINWNERFNLTAIVEKDEVISKHFLDSLSCFKASSKLPASVVDVGCGAGLPGLALKIVQPDIKLTLIESTGKKVKFLQHIVSKLDLKHVTILHKRAEEVGRLTAHREQYQLAVARAVARLAVLAEYMLPLVQKNGLMVAQKGANPVTTGEVADAKNALGILGGRYQTTIPITIPNLDAARHLVLVKKIKATPKQYPRKPGTPAKKPIK